MTAVSEKQFVRRLETTRYDTRRARALAGGCWILFALGIGFAGLASVDFAVELSRPVRVSVFCVIMGAAAILAVRLVLWRALWWGKMDTAIAVEGRFPSLGQRWRTLAQYAGLRRTVLEKHGVSSTLVTALAE